MTKFKLHLAAALAALTVPGIAVAVEPGDVTRIDPRQVTLHWNDRDPVSVYVASNPAAGISAATLVAGDVRTGTLTVPAAATERRYFLLRDGGDGLVVTVAERELPLERGSNFRDLGGYRGADGRAVKWGRIFRSGAMPLLTDNDYALLGGLKIGSIVELRSVDERMIAPTQLFEGFRRHDEDRRNGLLNYGYAVVRAALARACAASGLLPAFGIHHRSRTNPFNLVDDLIEPFRPVVDRMARARAASEERDELDVEDRRHMAGILSENISIGEERMTMLAATEAVAASLVRAIDGGNFALLNTPALPLARRS